MTLVWSKEKPKLGEWYWYRTPQIKPIIVFTESRGVVEWPWGTDSRIQDLRGEWAGPIPLPSEPISEELWAALKRANQIAEEEGCQLSLSRSPVYIFLHNLRALL